jgi:hypothetical protein
LCLALDIVIAFELLSSVRIDESSTGYRTLPLMPTFEMEAVNTTNVTINHSVLNSPTFAISGNSAKNVKSNISATAANNDQVEEDPMSDDDEKAPREKESEKSSPVAENGFVSAPVSVQAPSPVVSSNVMNAVVPLVPVYEKNVSTRVREVKTTGARVPSLLSCPVIQMSFCPLFLLK